ncbi:MAG: lysylphosphatidylglycerol synthase transmembrane domain-containing protein [Pseudomonadota bacterium]
MGLVARKLLVAILVTIFCFFILIRTVDVADVWSAIQHAEVFWVGILFVGVVCVTVLRGLRASLLVSQRFDDGVFLISIIHNAATALLPMKLGEIVFPVLIARCGRMNRIEAVGALLVLRAFDLFAILFTTAAAVAMIWIEKDAFIGVFATAAFLGLLVLLGGALLFWPRLITLAQMTSTQPTLKIIISLLRPLAQLRRSQVAQQMILSIVIWGVLIGTFLAGCRGLNLDVTYREMVVISAAASLAFAAPIAGVANVGPFQAAWLWASGFFGLEVSPALAAAFLVHGSFVLAISVIGVLAYFTLSLTSNSRTSSSGHKDHKVDPVQIA